MIRVLLLSLFFVGCEGVRPVLNLGALGLVEKKDNRVKDDQQDERLKKNEEKIRLLESIIDAQQDAIDLLFTNVSDLEGYDEYLETIINSLIVQLNNLEIQVEIDFLNVENQLNLIENDIAILQNASIAELIDPCGDGVGFDEILIKLGDGTLVAYFEQGSNRHITTVDNGLYMTTDAQACRFAVLDGQVSSKKNGGYLFTEFSDRNIDLKLTCVLDKTGEIGKSVVKIYNTNHGVPFTGYVQIDPASRVDFTLDVDTKNAIILTKKGTVKLFDDNDNQLSVKACQ